MSQCKVACGWDHVVDHIADGVVYGNVLIPIVDSIFKHPMKWDIGTGLPIDVDKYPTRYYMRLIKK